MKIYTKTGDKGITSLVGGKRVPKTHRRIEAYGAVDELNSWIGLIADDQKIGDNQKKTLHLIQNKLFVIGCNLASPSIEAAKKCPQLQATDILMLEENIDKIIVILPQLRTFVLPGGCCIASYCQIARTICRRAERDILRLKENERYSLEISYMNRLSDYLFVLARALVYAEGATERCWK
jgi:cob(I)alamin adenosyltransferase